MIQRDLKTSCPSATWIPWIQDFLFLGVVRCKMKPDQKHKCLEVSERHAPKRHGQQGLDWSQPSEAPSRPQTHPLHSVYSLKSLQPQCLDMGSTHQYAAFTAKSSKSCPNVSGHFTASKLGSNLWDHGYPAMLTWKRNWTHAEDGFSRDSMSTKRGSFLPLRWLHVSNQHQSAMTPWDLHGAPDASSRQPEDCCHHNLPSKTVQCYQRKSWLETASWPMHAMLASTRSAVICPPRLHSLHFLANASELL